MPPGGTIVERSLRKVLADSHIAAITIAVLLTWSLQWILSALWSPFVLAADIVIDAIGILGIPFGVGHFSFADRLTLIASLSYCLYALTAVAASWLISNWVYGMTPFRTLRAYHAKFARRDDA